MNLRPPSRLRPATSAYIDLLRVIAVALVFIDHAKRAEFTGGFLLGAGQFGNEAVALFFVISGLVIGYVAHTRERSLGSYAVNRLARLWSVAAPALLLTVILDVVGRHLDPSLYALDDLPPPWSLGADSLWRFLAPLFFLNAVLDQNVVPGTNGPFWSLGFEAWYYLGFGAAFFLRGWTRALTLLIVITVAGRNILALAPLWLLGVAVYHRLGRGGPARWTRASWLLTAAAALAYAAFKFPIEAALAPHLPSVLSALMPPRVFLETYIPALLAAANIFCFDRLGPAAILRLAASLKTAAACSFSIYLYQAPLLFFVAALAQPITSRPLRIVLLYAAPLIASILLCSFTERQKPRLAQALRRWTRVR